MDIFAIIIFSFIGIIFGTITGLIPGFHTNNVAIIVVSLTFLHSMEAVALIASAAITHTFVDILPSIFMGVPDEDTSLAILPAHSMLLDGMAFRAVRISAYSSLAGLTLAFALLLPYHLIAGYPLNLYDFLSSLFPWILVAISLIMIFTSSNVWRTLAIYLLSGIFGVVVLKMPNSLFPALSGLFGASSLVLARRSEIPEQSLDEKDVEVSVADIASGTVAGAFISLIPGITSSIATLIALVTRKVRDRERIIAVLSSSNTSTSFFVMAALFVISRARSGFAIQIQKIIGVQRWYVSIPSFLPALILSSLIAGFLAFFITIFIGKEMSKRISSMDYSLLSKFSMVFLFIIVFIFSGISGILIFITATLIGVAGIEMGVRRSTFMAVLLLPLILTYFSQFL